MGSSNGMISFNDPCYSQEVLKLDEFKKKTLDQ